MKAAAGERRLRHAFMALPTVSADEPRWLMTSNHMNPSKDIRMFRIRHGSAWAFGNLSATAIKLRLAGVQYWRLNGSTRSQMAIHASCLSKMEALHLYKEPSRSRAPGENNQRGEHPKGKTSSRCCLCAPPDRCPYLLARREVNAQRDFSGSRFSSGPWAQGSG
jgi:hypothetical protein